MANTLSQTTLSAALSSTATVLNVASATNISAPVNGFFQQLYIVDPGSMRGELMTVTAVNGTVISVSRLDQFRSKHLSGAIVIIAPVNQGLGNDMGFRGSDPAVVPGSVPILTWEVNVVTGAQWLYSTVTGSWVPGFGNTTAPASPTAAVASAAGLITPSGPLFHVTGTAAITGFNIPNGFASGSFVVIPDAVFTWTAANNIAVAGTAVVGKALTFTYDFNSGKLYPSYIA